MPHQLKHLLASHNNFKLECTNDALDIIGSGIPACIFTLDDLQDDFFDLSNKSFGEIMQKFVNYRYPIAIVMPKDHGYSKRVDELILDHRNHNSLRFFESVEQAYEWISHI